MTAPASLSISLNGLDGVGKTTQLRLLLAGWPGVDLVGPVDRWHPGWAAAAAGDFADWWFRTSIPEELTNLFVSSHQARRANSGPIALEDRGQPMLCAAGAATRAVRENTDIGQALQTVSSQFTSDPTRAEVHVLLRSGSPTDPPARPNWSGEPPRDATYEAYQTKLAEALHLQQLRGDYHIVLDVTDIPILEVQARLRSELAVHADLEPLPLSAIDALWVLGGLSESGKSTVGDFMHYDHAHARLKIGYLLAAAANRQGVRDPYGAWTDIEQAEHLSLELVNFAHANKISKISIESARSLESTAHLQRLWGARCTVLYLDVPQTSRVDRTPETTAELAARDSEKKTHGADGVADIADEVINNDRSRAHLRGRVSSVVRQHTFQLLELPTGWRAPHHQEWLARIRQHVLDDSVAAILATGSTCTTDWRNHWSDLDVLVVRDELPSQWVRDTAASIPRPKGMKVGLSLVTTDEIDTTRISPRLLVALQRARHGTGVLYCRPGFRPRLPDRGEIQRRRVLHEFPIIILTTRRLLSEPTVRVKALYKHCLLIQKVLLGEDAHDIDRTDEVIDAFRRLHPTCDVDLPHLDEMIAQRNSKVNQQRLITAADSILRYEESLHRPHAAHPVRAIGKELE